MILRQYLAEGETAIAINVAILSLMSGGHYDNNLHIYSNGENLSIPLYFTVKALQHTLSE